MDQTVILKKFQTLEEASGAIEIIEKNNIKYTIEKTATKNDSVFAGNTIAGELIVKVNPEDLEAAQKLLEELVEVDVEKLDKDYYLFEFSDNELVEILKKPDEWSLNDFVWAQEILKQRGKEVDQSTIEHWKNERLEYLSRPEAVSDNYITGAYLLCLLGGFIGFFMGRHIKAYRKLLPNGQKVYAFDERSRERGKNVEIAGLLFMILYFGLMLYFISSL